MAFEYSLNTSLWPFFESLDEIGDSFIGLVLDFFYFHDFFLSAVSGLLFLSLGER